MLCCQSVVSAFALMEHVLPAFADGIAHFFGAVVNIDVTLPDGSDDGNIKTVQYVSHPPHRSEKLSSLQCTVRLQPRIRQKSLA
jgi:hypothetical protein